MALRSLIRKMPALALSLRSPPMAMAHRMGAVHALSPAAGSRLMSHAAPKGQTSLSEKLAKVREQTKRNQALTVQYQKDLQKKLAIVDELQRGCCDTKVNFHEKLRKLEKICDIGLCILVPANVMVYMALFSKISSS